MIESDANHPAKVDATIRPFQPGDQAAFQRLNEAWIGRYFRIEPKDEQTLTDPQRTILDKGGKILLAVAGNECVGCCALLRMSDGEYEVAKMAVAPSHQGAGVGRRLLEATIEEGRNAGARRLYLETNHVLTSAIRLYESAGFSHLDPARVLPSPYARADVFMELILS
ncbi:MAG: GNAT family N-acetyltransferase [Terracidiphilus sp.]